MFEGIGRINTYLKQQDLKLQANYKIKNGKSLKDLTRELDKAKNDFISQYKAGSTNKNSSSSAAKMRVALIRQKLRRGKELSADDLRILKENDADLYAKAKKAQKARDELKLALKQAKTKEEVNRAVMQAQIKVAAEAQLEAKNGGGITIGNSGGGSESMASGEASAAASFSSDINGDIGESNVENEKPAAANELNNQDMNAATNEIADNGTNDDNSNADKIDADKDSKDKKLAALKEYANSNSDKDLAMPMEKFLFILAALQDEWHSFTHTKTYNEMPNNYIDEEKDKNSSLKQPYRPKSIKPIDLLAGYKPTPYNNGIGCLLEIISK